MRIEAITDLDLRLGNAGWAFADAERVRIDAHWREISARNARIWNGDVLICTSATIDAGALTARFAITDYASFVAWRDWGWPDASVINCFGTPAARTSDGALVFGVMAGHTLNAGMLYPPSGSLEPRDVRDDGTIDVKGSIAIELMEETGLDAGSAEEGRLIAIFDGPRLAIVQELTFPMTCVEIAASFAAHMTSQGLPELVGLEAIRSPSQIDSRMPGFAQEIVRYFLPSPRS